MLTFSLYPPSVILPRLTQLTTKLAVDKSNLSNENRELAKLLFENFRALSGNLNSSLDSVDEFLNGVRTLYETRFLQIHDGVHD